MRTLALALMLAGSIVAATSIRAAAQSAPQSTARADSAAKIGAKATASKTEVSVGESFTIEVRASGPAGTTFEFPGDAVQESFELQAIVDSVAPAPGIQRYRAAVFALGDAEVPAIPVRYRAPDGATGEVQTAAIPLKVVSLLPKDEAERKLADVRGPVGLSIGRLFWIALAAVVLIAAALVWWIVLRRRRPKAAAAAPAIPALEPDEEARRALAALGASGRLEREEYRLFYIDLTAIAKRYLERRLGAPIVEMTSAETLAYLRASEHGTDLAPHLRDLTNAADEIKFARGSGIVEEAERHLAATRAVIERLEARLKPAPPAGEKAA